MKKLIIILALTVFNTGVYAQKVFDETVFNGMMSRLQTDPAFFKNEVDPSFILTFGNGQTTNQESMLKYAENNIGLYKPKYTNLKVNQFGNAGIVTGTNEETFLSKANPSVVARTSKHLFTYTFAKIKNNWIWVAGQHTQFPTPFTKENLNEIMAEYKADSKAFMNDHLSENFRYINPKGGFQPRKDFIGSNKQSIITTEMLEPVILQSGNLAVTSGIHQTVRTTSDGRQVIGQVGATYTWQNIGGKWMFVASQQIPVAPATFDETTFTGLMSTWRNDPINFIKNEIDPKAIFTNGNGALMTQKQMAEAFGNGTTLNDKKVEDLKVYQSGNTGVATGKTFESYNNGQFLYTGRFTYTFSQQNGKWIMASGQHTDFRSPKEEDEAAIKSKIISDAASFDAAEYTTYKNNWSKASPCSFLYNAGLFVGDDLWKKMDEVWANKKPQNVIREQSNMNIRINGSSAFVTFKQVNTNKTNGSISDSFEERYMEKISGEWKNVNNTVWNYPRKK